MKKLTYIPIIKEAKRPKSKFILRLNKMADRLRLKRRSARKLASSKEEDPTLFI